MVSLKTKRLDLNELDAVKLQHFASAELYVPFNGVSIWAPVVCVVKQIQRFIKSLKISVTEKNLPMIDPPIIEVIRAL